MVYKTDVPVVTIDDSRREMLVRCSKFELRASFDLLQSLLDVLVLACQDEHFEHYVVGQNTETGVPGMVVVHSGSLEYEQPKAEHMYIFEGSKCYTCQHDLIVAANGLVYCVNDCDVIQQPVGE
jgi:hypothetical protein